MSQELIRAARYGDAAIVKVLLEQGTDVHADNDYALDWAARNGHTDTVKLLLDHGANVHADNDCALRWAAEKDEFAVMALLVKHGADYSFLPEFKDVERQRVVELLVARAVAREVAT